MIIAQLPLASEIANLLNFFICDIILVAIIMKTTSVLAGIWNQFQFSKSKGLYLHSVPLPHVGGGIVMRHSFSLVALVLIRVSVIAAICVSNFGLQGRSEPSFISRDVSIRRPGPFPKMPPVKIRNYLFDTTQIRKRCLYNGDGDIKFASVFDEKCFPQMRTELYIKTLALKFVNVTRTLKNCKRVKTMPNFFTTVQCDDIDMNCLGPHGNTGILDPASCEAVVYDGDVSWHCPYENGFHLDRRGAQKAECRKVGAKRNDIHLWTTLYRYHTDDAIEALFGAAYGVQTSIKEDVPSENKNVTNVTLWWLIPIAWVILVLVASSIWVVVMRCYGITPIAHDERSLVRMLEEKSDIESSTASNRVEVDW